MEKDWEEIIYEEVSPCNMQNVITDIERVQSDIEESEYSEEEKEKLSNILREKVMEIL